MVFNPTSVFYLVLHHQHPQPPHHRRTQQLLSCDSQSSTSSATSSLSSSDPLEAINSNLLLSSSPEFDSPCQQQGTITATVSQYLNHQETATGKTRSSSVEDGQPAVISLRGPGEVNRTKSEEGTSASGSAAVQRVASPSSQAGIDESSNDSMKPKMPQLQIKLGLAVFKPPHELWCQVGDLIEIDRTLYSYWALYTGNGNVIHICGQDGADLTEEPLAWVKESPLAEVAAGSFCRVNNKVVPGKERGLEPLPVAKVLAEAYKHVGKRIPYNLVTQNYEHYLTQWKYGAGWSDQANIHLTAIKALRRDSSVDQGHQFLVNSLQSVLNSPGTSLVSNSGSSSQSPGVSQSELRTPPLSSLITSTHPLPIPVAPRSPSGSLSSSGSIDAGSQTESLINQSIIDELSNDGSAPPKIMSTPLRNLERSLMMTMDSPPLSLDRFGDDSMDASLDSTDQATSTLTQGQSTPRSRPSIANTADSPFTATIEIPLNM